MARFVTEWQISKRGQVLPLACWNIESGSGLASCLLGKAKDKTSYLDSAGQSNCNGDVEQAGPQDLDKTLKHGGQVLPFAFLEQEWRPQHRSLTSSKSGRQRLSLLSFAGEKSGTKVSYLNLVHYDKFEQRTRLVLGNGIETRLKGSPISRPSN